MVSVFNDVDKFQDLCILTNQPKSDAQLKNIAYIIFNKPRLFMEALKAWNIRESTENTCTSFKIYIRKEYNKLRKVGALTINQSTINQQVNNTQELPTNNEPSSEISRELHNTNMDVIMLINQAPEEPISEPQGNLQGNASTAKSVLSLTQMVKTLQDRLDKMSKPAPVSKDINPKNGKA